MPVYLWEGRTAQGKVLKGEMEAASADAVRNSLLFNCD